MNDENLIPLNKKSKEAQRRIQSKGGKARQKKLAERKKAKEAMQMLLDLQETDTAIRAKMGMLGISDEDMTNQSVMLVSLMRRAQKGDAQAVKLVLQIMGEFTEKVEQTGANGLPIPQPISIEVIDRREQVDRPTEDE